MLLTVRNIHIRKQQLVYWKSLSHCMLSAAGCSRVTAKLSTQVAVDLHSRCDKKPVPAHTARSKCFTSSDFVLNPRLLLLLLPTASPHLFFLWFTDGVQVRTATETRRKTKNLQENTPELKHLIRCGIEQTRQR